MTIDEKLILVKQAFMKLQSYYAQDNYNLHIRFQIADFSVQNNRDRKLRNIARNLDDPSSEYWVELFDSIDIITLPKRVSPSVDKNFPFGIPQNFMHNSLQDSDGILERVMIFGSFPVELQIVAVLWVMVHGVFLENGLPSGAKGNRLLLSKEGFLTDGRTMFKPYVRQFASWWREGWKETQTLLDKGQSATLLNFDFKDYYHRVQLDWKSIRAECKRLRSINSGRLGSGHQDALGLQLRGKSADNLWTIMRNMHESYTSVLQNSFPDKYIDSSKVDQGNLFTSLPLGLLSSPILANVFLQPLDRYFEKEVRPVYYGRYVDDVMVVFRGPHLEAFGKKEVQWLLDEFPDHFDKKTIRNLAPEDKAKLLATFFLLKYVHGAFKVSEINAENGFDVVFCTSDEISPDTNLEFENLRLQSEKTKLYQFAPGLTGIVLDKFLKEQESRSSAFAFLSESADNEINTLDNIEFETSFLHPQSSEGRFRAVEESRFRMSVYLYRQIDIVLKGQVPYENSKLKKLTKYFSGIVLLQQYVFWEKLFTLLLASDSLTEFVKLEARILYQIHRLQISDGLMQSSRSEIVSLDSPQPVLETTKQGLLEHLEFSMGMAIGLLPEKIDSLKKLGLKSSEYEEGE